MVLIKNHFKFNPILVINLIFAFFPISFILGNLIINLNILLFCCFGIFHLRHQILKIKYNYSIKIIFLFFFIIFLSTFLSFIKFLYIDGYEYINLSRLIKSLVFFRFFILLLTIYILVEFDILDFKYFFISAAFFPILVSLDIIFQYFVGFNIIGIESYSEHHIKKGTYVTGFFGDELIAGGYIKNFSFFALVFLIFKFKNKIYFKFFSIILAINILGVGILLSGNRIPLTLFFMGLFLIFFFNLNLKKIIIVSLLSLYITFNFLFSFDAAKEFKFGDFYNKARFVINTFNKNLFNPDKNEVYKVTDWGYIDKTNVNFLNRTEETRYRSLYTRMKNLQDKDPLLYDFDSFWVKNNSRDGHIKLFLTGLDLWRKNIIFGNGIKSFRLDCAKLQLHKEYRLCSNHPHNYYIEILTETGVIGLISIMLISLLFAVFIFKNFKFLRGTNKEILILLASTISLIIEAFPARSTGSIFTTHNATYIILIASIILCYQKILNRKKTTSTAVTDIEN